MQASKKRNAADIRDGIATSTYLSADQVRRLDALGIMRNRSRSHLVREAVTAYLAVQCDGAKDS